ncbi:hypothetical protein [Oceanihabitans sediminis]|uniref:hypothetical protein n=1 Tax=Oceanihabitans sediminis TaxID=1812012 RepID=UPI00299D6F99|nr:hypothetical protein [Oceanihabitans sediminis]MDX1279356.1 hypothetical protein [Oceanihabitans sediminis]
MGLKKHYINGKEKTKEQQLTDCPTCANGDIFEKETKTTKYQADNSEHICGACNTKYIIPRVTADKLINMECLECPNICGETCGSKETDLICIGNIDIVYQDIRKQMEGDKVSLDDLTLMEQFDRTGKCPGHQWIETKPFRTAEGQFVLNTCKICQLGSVNYKGKVYTDRLMKIVSFIATQGINFHKKVLEEEKKFETLTQKQDLKQDIKLSGLFSNEIPQTKPLSFISDEDKRMEKMILETKEEKPELSFINDSAPKLNFVSD